MGLLVDEKQAGVQPIQEVLLVGQLTPQLDQLLLGVPPFAPHFHFAQFAEYDRPQPRQVVLAHIVMGPFPDGLRGDGFAHPIGDQDPNAVISMAATQIGK